MTWKERLIGLPLAALGALLLVATAAGMLLTRTDWGREKVRSFALEKLNAAIRGEVEIDEVLEGDLLRMVRVAGVTIYEPDGRVFARIDTLSVHYRWADFLIGNVTLPKATLVGPVVNLRVDPESGWNFEQVFAGRGGGSEPDADDGEGRRRRIVLEEVAIRSGDVSLRTEWEPEPGSDPDSSRWFLERTENGWERVIRLERLNATLPNARVAAPSEQGRLFQISQLVARASIIGAPVEIEQLRADIEVVHDTLSFQVWQANLPESELFGQGWVTLRSDPDYEFTLRGSPVTTGDLVWLIPQLPPGVANLDFHYLSHQGQIAMEARNATWESSDARATGDFAMALRGGSDGLRFNGVDLQVDRAHTSLIESLTGWSLPVSADLAGEVVLDGPLSALRVDADVLIEREGQTEASHVIAAGIASLEEDDLGGRDLEVVLDAFRLDLVRAFVPGLTVRGTLDGAVTLNGRLSNQLRVDLDIEHRDGDLVPTRLRDGGTITKRSGEPLRLDVGLTVDTVSLATLSEYFPGLPVRGTFTGRVGARGALDDLQLTALLRGVGDSLRVEGNRQSVGGRARYDGTVEGWNLQLPEFRRDMPASNIDFRFELLEAEGTDIATLEGRGRARVNASFVGGVQFDSAVAELRVAGGRLGIDTAVAVGEFGELRAVGAVSLVRHDSDSLRFELDADSLGAFNSWLFPELESLAAPGRLSTIADAASAPSTSGVEGEARIRGWLVRRDGRFAIRGEARGERFTYTSFSADSFQVERFEVQGADSGLVARGDIIALGAGLGDLRFGEVRLTGEHVGARTDLEFRVRQERASLSGSLWAEWEAESRDIGVRDLTAQLGETVWQLQSPALVHYEQDGFAVRDVELVSTSGRALLDGFVNDSGPIGMRARLSGVELADVASLWRDTTEMSGLVTLDVELSGVGRRPTLQGTYEVVDGYLYEVDFSRLEGAVDYDGRELSLDAALWRGETRMAVLSGTLPFDLEVPSFGVTIPDRTVDLTLDGDSIPLVLARVVTDQIVDVGGHGAGSVEFGGTPGDLSLAGSATLTGGRFRVLRSGIRYRNLSGGVVFEGREARLNEVTFGSDGGGRGNVSGTVTFTSLSNPRFDLSVRAEALPAYDQLDARAVVSGVISLRGAYEAPVVSGDLSVVSGVLFVEEIGRQREIVDPFISDMSLLEEILGAEAAQRVTPNPFMDNLTMDLGLNVEQNTWLRSAEMNVEIVGELTVAMRPGEDEWRITGTLRAVRGDYRMFNKRFEVVDGTIEFVGTEGVNPNLRIVSLFTVQTQKQPIVIRLVIGGTLEDMTLSLESDHRPPISESDLLSYLLFGRPAFELTRASAERSLLNDVASGVPQAFVGYALSSLLVGEAGIAYVDVSRVASPAVEGEYRSGVGPALAATQVEVGWYLAPTVFVSVAQHLVGAVRPTIRLDWRLEDRLTLRGITEPRFGREGVLFYGGPGSSDFEQSIGLFLFYGWSY